MKKNRQTGPAEAAGGRMARHSIPSNILFWLKIYWKWEPVVVLLAVLELILGALVPLVGIYLPKLVLDLLAGQTTAAVLVRTLGLWGILVAALYGLRNGLYGKYFVQNSVRSYLMPELFLKSLRVSYEIPESEWGKRAYQEALGVAAGGDWSASTRTFDSTLEILQNILCFVLYSTVLGVLNPWIILMLLVLSLLNILVIEKGLHFEDSMREREAQHNRHWNYILSAMGNMTAAKDVRIFGMHSWLGGIRDHAVEDMEEDKKAYQRLHNWQQAMNGLIGLVRDVAAYGYLIYSVSKGQITVSDFVLYFGAVTGFSGFVTGILHQVGNLKSARNATDYFRAYMALPEEVSEEESMKALAPNVQKRNMGGVTCDAQESNKGGVTCDAQESNKGGKACDAQESNKGGKTCDAQESNKGGKACDAQESNKGGKTCDAQESNKGGKTCDAQESNKGGKTCDAQGSNKGGKTCDAQESNKGGKTCDAQGSNKGGVTCDGHGGSKSASTVKNSEIFEGTDGQVPDDSKSSPAPGIIFEDVSFAYKKEDGTLGEKILEHFNLTIAPGEKLALVGVNGAGKTTLVKLLCGLYQPDEGRILVDGRSREEMTPGEWYQLLSVVFQEQLVLPITIAENLSLQRREETDDEKAWAALEKAGLSETFARQKLTLDTFMKKTISRKGIELSGGQQQRLMLARALYKDAPLLVLDEPTAALDPIAESEVYESYLRHSRGKTAIFISHRLASTRFSDRIILLDHGRIQEEGTHEQLMESGGAYAHMYQVQSSYYEKEAKAEK